MLLRIKTPSLRVAERSEAYREVTKNNFSTSSNLRAVMIYL